MKPELIGLAGLVLVVTPAAAQHHQPAAYAALRGHVPVGACEVRLDAPYISPRLPLGRAAYAHRTACRTTWAPGSAGPGVHVQGPPIEVGAPPVSVGGLMIYLVPPEIRVRPSEVTVEPPQVHAVGAEEAEGTVPDPGE